LELKQASLVCTNRHTFNVSAKGFVSLLRSDNANSDLYDRTFFEHRSAVFEAGMYEHVASLYCDSVSAALSTSEVSSQTPINDKESYRPRVLDAGCGEGYYMRRLAATRQWQSSANESAAANLIAIDLSKDAVALAAKGGGDIEWAVSDLAHIPLKDHTIDCVTNVFSPANYLEFQRILRPGGTLIKIIPGPRHVKELREAIAQAGLREDARYSNEQVRSGISEHMHIVSSTSVSATTRVDAALLQDFMAMTPVMFHIDQAELDLEKIHTITIEAELIVAKR
jgi:23S rRNA (guanine745-N1)-methyltransferase